VAWLRVGVRGLVQLVVSCVVLGVGVTLLLLPALGSDGYSTLVNGIAISSGIPFVVVNCVLGAVLVGVAWVRGLRPGVGTLVQPVVVGFTISGLLWIIPEPESLVARALLLLAAFPVLALGVAGYLGTGLGAGPTEAAALAWDPPVPFRWSYSLVQAVGALVGWFLGAAIGPGTLAVIVLLGPMVDALSRWIPALDVHARSRSAALDGGA